MIPREHLPDPEAEAIPTTRNESVADIERRYGRRMTHILG